MVKRGNLLPNIFDLIEYPKVDNAAYDLELPPE